MKPFVEATTLIESLLNERLKGLWMGYIDK